MPTERSIPRSDWGPIDGQVEDPVSSEPENINIREPQSNHSDNKSEKSEDICIPTNIEAREEEALQVFFHQLNTAGPAVPRPPSQNTQFPSIVATLMATATQTATHTPTIGHSSGGGGGGSGGGGGGGGPPGGAAGPGPGQASGGAKLV